MRQHDALKQMSRPRSCVTLSLARPRWSLLCSCLQSPLVLLEGLSITRLHSCE